FLMLDEPTNHLDLLGKEALEESLGEYEGTMLFVSHDRYFISKLATAILEIKDGQATYYPLTYEEYLEKDRQAPKEQAHEAKESGKKPYVAIQLCQGDPSAGGADREKGNGAGGAAGAALRTGILS
ncbi:MAG: hypothetical protein ACLVJ6_17010, partial [Merdibacter sp.]